jgi:hypothetical protein
MPRPRQDYIKVQFSGAGFYHPALGRLGVREDDKGKIYEIPALFRDMLPARTTIFDDVEELEDALEDAQQPAAERAQVIDEAELPDPVAPGAARGPAPQDAMERTGLRRSRRRVNT